MISKDTLGEAIAEDVAGHLVEAADLYEQVIVSEDAPLDAFLNLAVLYWDHTDPGSPLISHEFFHRSAQRYEEVLLTAGKIYGDECEVKFWRLYSDYISLGGPTFRDECKKIVAACDCLVPFFYLYGFPDGPSYGFPGEISPELQKYEEQANRLAAQCSLTLTAKNRYILSVLNVDATKASNSQAIRHQLP